MKRVMQWKVIFQVLSNNLLILAAALTVSLAISLVYSEASMPFIIPMAISLVAGITLRYANHAQRQSITIGRKEAYLTVTLSWIMISLVGSLPFILSGSIPSFVDAFFESTSGFTTTGSSILTDIEILPKSILFWRSLTHWIGGIGIIVLVIVVMPSLQIGSYHLFTMESSMQEKIQPKIKSIGKRLLLIYLLLTASEVAFLLAGKMSLFDSICHAFGTVATGGFSPKNTSIAEYSPYIQYVIMVFMFLAGTNFVVHYYLFKSEFKKVKTNEELKFYVSVILVIGSIITAILIFKMNKPIETAFREAFFQVISIITCTGFATTDYLQWPTLAWALIFLSMFFGGSTGSTAGGIKMARHLILLKNISRIFKQTVCCNAIFHIRFNKRTINDETNHSILTFIAIYFIVFVAGSLLLALCGLDGQTATSAAATCMAGIGPGIGTIGPVSNFAHLPDLAKAILIFLMLVGRLEIYTIIILFSRNFWKR